MSQALFAIVRFDAFLGPSAPPEESVTVTKIVTTQAEAVREVDRLNSQAPPDCRYFWQATRSES